MTHAGTTSTRFKGQDRWRGIPFIRGRTARAAEDVLRYPPWTRPLGVGIEQRSVKQSSDFIGYGDSGSHALKAIQAGY
jgi:hypothetical protein